MFFENIMLFRKGDSFYRSYRVVCALQKLIPNAVSKTFYNYSRNLLLDFILKTYEQYVY